MKRKSIMRPSLGALRAFVVSARAGSFTLAAEQLNITQGAVSQQIAKLEDMLGVRLFEREGRLLTLTTAGQRLFRGIRGSMDRIDAELDAVRVNCDSRVLSISTFGSFAAQWLVPKLREFEVAFPNISVQIDTTTRLIDFDTEAHDVGIRFGTGNWLGLVAEPLLQHRVHAVTTPEYVAHLDLSPGPQALLNVPLIYDLETPTEWARWFAASGLDKVEPRLERGFSDTLVMLSALLAGMSGVALVGDHLTHREIEGGRLVQLFETYIEPDGAYFLVYPQARQLSSAGADFRDWLLASVAV